MKQLDLSLIIPAYREAEIIGDTLKKVAEFIKKNPQLGTVEVLVVVANSTDDTAKIANELGKKFANFKLIEPGRKVGKGRDVQAGMLAATGKKRIFTDADLSTPLHHILAMTKMLDTHEVVIGTRTLSKIHRGLRSFMSQMGNLLIRMLLLWGHTDTQCGFKGFQAKAAEELFGNLGTRGWGFDLDILAQAHKKGFSIYELPLPDWTETRLQGLREESHLGVAVKSLFELLHIRLRLWQTSLDKIMQPLNRFAWVAPLAAVTTFAALASQKLGQWSLWLDEAFTAEMICHPIEKILEFTAKDVHPPLYYLLLQSWTSVFGTSEVGLRSFSVLCMSAAILIGFLLVKRTLGKRAAYFALPVLVLAPYLIRFGMEARMYALAALICIAATYVLLQATEAKKHNNRWWAAYGILLALGMYTHYYTVLVWFVHWVWRWYVVQTQAHNVRTRLKAFFTKPWLASHGLAILLFLPWLPIMLYQFTHIQTHGFWVKDISHNQLLNVISQALVYVPHQQAKHWLSVALIAGIAALGYLVYRTYKTISPARRPYYVLLLLYAFLPIIALFALSLPPLKPIFIERSFAHTMLGFYLLIGATLALAPAGHKWFRSKTVLTGLIFSLLAIGFIQVQIIGNHTLSDLGQPRAKELMAHLGKRIKADQAIVGNSWSIFYEIKYYQIPDKTFFYDRDYGVGDLGVTAMLVNSPQQVHDLTSFGETKKSVWLVGINNIDINPPQNWHEVESYSVDHYHAVRFETH